MKDIKHTLVFIVLGIFSAHCHTYLSSVVVNGVAQPDNDCIRPHYPGSAGVYANSPVNDRAVFPNGLLSNNMTCGFLPYAGNPANKKCTLAAGSTVGLQWHHDSTGPTDDIIDSSHKGPVMAYMAKADGVPSTGNVWFKIYEAGYANGKWASTDVLKANNGLVNVVIPSDITPGNYLLRGEVIALHDGDKPNGVQPYVSCVELTVTGSGTVNPTGVAIPGVYQKTDPGIAFNLYNGYTSYPIPGPRPYTAGSTSSVASSSTSSVASSSSSGSGGSACANPQACVDLCGVGNVAVCSCLNGESQIVCGKSSASQFVVSFVILFVMLVISF